MKLFASLLPLSALVLTAFASVPAAAQTPRPAATTTTKTADYTERMTGGDQVVTFTGDELPGDSNSFYGHLIRPTPGVTRVGLIRPRLNFVPELLKSVENL